MLKIKESRSIRYCALFSLFFSFLLSRLWMLLRIEDQGTLFFVKVLLFFIFIPTTLLLKCHHIFFATFFVEIFQNNCYECLSLCTLDDRVG